MEGIKDSILKDKLQQGITLSTMDTLGRAISMQEA